MQPYPRERGSVKEREKLTPLRLTPRQPGWFKFAKGAGRLDLKMLGKCGKVGVYKNNSFHYVRWYNEKH